MISSMRCSFSLVDPSLPLPSYQTKGAIAFDVYSRVDMMIKPWQPTIIPLNIIVRFPKGYGLVLAARSSSADRYGFILANGIGLIDQDYCGPEDEVGLKVLNFTKKVIRIKKGDRVGQAVFVKIAKSSFTHTKKIMGKSRGGWGSTGRRTAHPAK